MDRALRDKKAICIFVLPGFIWFCVIVLIPIIQSGIYSFLDWDGVTQPEFIGLGNYTELIKDSLFRNAVLNSLILVAASVFIQLPIAMVLAMILATGVRGEKKFVNIYFIPVIISGTIIASLWMKIYHPSYGLLNKGLEMIGLDFLANEWLGNTETAIWACIVPMIWQYIGYHMLLLYSSAKSIDTSILEAAKVDGANKIQSAIKISLPLMMPMLKACTIFAVIGSFKSFDLIYILTKGGPVHSTEVPSLLMYTSIFTTNRYGYASAISIFIILECLIATILIQKGFKKIQKGGA